MARRNSSSSLDRWTERAGNAPYRASTDNFVVWDTSLPSPNLAAASRVSPGGRLLVAFELAAIRDFFVEGHFEGGAQIEADHAQRATARRKVVTSNVAPVSLDESFDRVRVATRDERIAEGVIEREYGEAAIQLMGVGRLDDAAAIINSLPSGVFTKTLLLSKMLDSGWDRDRSISMTNPAPYTIARAEALVQWQRAKFAEKAAINVMTGLLEPLVEQFVRTGDREGFAALIAQVPPCVEKAFLMDRLDYGMRRSA